MTATASATPTPGALHPTSGADALAGTGALVRLALRRDRLRLTLWVLAVGVLPIYTATALDTVYPTAADRQARATLMENPAAVILGGPGFGRDDYTLGAMLANEMGLTLMIAVAIMSVLLVVRHTRTEEESGRAELVRACVVGHRAHLAAALVLAALANAAIVAVTVAGLAAIGLPGPDSLAFAVGVGLTGMVLAAVAGVTAQLSEHTRAASGAALGLLGVAAVVRGVGDIAEPGGSLLSWFSPIAWAQQTRAFVELRWWPLLLSVTLIVVATGLAHRLAGRRDLGAGLRPPRTGAAGASPLLSGATALTARLQRGTFTGWAVGLALTGVTFGSLADAVLDAVADNAQLSAFLAAGATRDLTDAFLARMLTYLALGSAAFAVTSVLRLRAEETAGRVEPLLAASAGRVRWLAGGLLVTLAGSTLLLLAGGLATGIAAALTLGDGRLVAVMTGACLAFLPAVLVIAGIAAALVGLAPRLSALAWAVLGYALLVGMFGVLLDLPGWAMRLSPLEWVPALPGEPLDLAPLAGLTVLATALVAAGLTGIRGRDIGTA
ncbi:ABC transporter permease [Pseudonocardia hispaniensis]|uniref:ABC transporter permease n=1 Tax=Pseudonocardia hispaniensis TaxID=904933 RepID=A0ABW1IZ59_9PSEU